MLSAVFLRLEAVWLKMETRESFQGFIGGTILSFISIVQLDHSCYLLSSRFCVLNMTLLVIHPLFIRRATYVRRIKSYKWFPRMLFIVAGSSSSASCNWHYKRLEDVLQSWKLMFIAGMDSQDYRFKAVILSEKNFAFALGCCVKNSLGSLFCNFTRYYIMKVSLFSCSTRYLLLLLHIFIWHDLLWSKCRATSSQSAMSGYFGDNWLRLG